MPQIIITISAFSASFTEGPTWNSRCPSCPFQKTPCIGRHLWWNVHAWKAIIGCETRAARTHVHFSIVTSKMVINDVMCNPSIPLCCYLCRYLSSVYGGASCISSVQLHIWYSVAHETVSRTIQVGDYWIACFYWEGIGDFYCSFDCSVGKIIMQFWYLELSVRDKKNVITCF